MRWRPQTPPTIQLPQLLRVARIPSERIAVGGGGGNDDEQERLLPFLLLFFFHLFSANPLPSSIPPPLNPHNRQVDDCVAGEEEVLIEGVEVEVEAEEVAEYVGVGKNN